MISSIVFIFILENINFTFQDNKRLLHSSGHHSSNSHHSSSGFDSSDYSLTKSKDQSQTNNELNTIKWDKPIYKKGPIIVINYYIILYGLNYQYQQNSGIRYLNIYNDTHWCKVELNYNLYNISQIEKFFELFQKNESDVSYNYNYTDIYYIDCKSSNSNNEIFILKVLFIIILVSLCCCYCCCNEYSRFNSELW